MNLSEQKAVMPRLFPSYVVGIGSVSGRPGIA